MKVIKEKSREYNGKAYYKYRFNLPTKIIKDAQIKENEEFDIKIEGKKIIINRK